MSINKLLEDTPESYYWLGFLVADGCFYFPKNSISLSLCEKDKNHVITFSKFISSNINTYTAKLNGKKFKQYTTHKSDVKYFSTIIKKFKINPIKTYNPPNINIKNDNLFLSFLIGFIDGDGSIYKDSTDNVLAIECHSSWKKTLNRWFNRCWKLSGIQTKLTYSFKIPKVIITKKHGLARIRTTNWRLLWFLKNSAKNLKLPILERKWKNINKKDKRFENSLKLKLKIIKYYKKGLIGNDIAKKLGRDYGYVYEIIRNKNKHIKIFEQLK